MPNIRRVQEVIDVDGHNLPFGHLAGDRCGKNTFPAAVDAVDGQECASIWRQTVHEGTDGVAESICHTQYPVSAPKSAEAGRISHAHNALKSSRFTRHETHRNRVVEKVQKSAKSRAPILFRKVVSPFIVSH